MGIGIKIGLNEVGKPKFWRAFGAEFLGCFFFLICVTSVAATPASTVVQIGVGIGLSIATLAQAFGHVSGGHLNPAVSFAAVLAGRIPIIRGIFYIVAQISGGIAGSAVTYGCTRHVVSLTLGVNNLAKGIKQEQGFAIELVFTFFLVFLVLSITDENRYVEPYGKTYGIGVCIFVAHVCIIQFTGCGINPTRSFGPAVIMNKWDNHWVYWAGPFSGALLAAPIYNFIFYVDDDDVSADIQTTNIQMKQEKSVI